MRSPTAWMPNGAKPLGRLRVGERRRACRPARTCRPTRRPGRCGSRSRTAAGRPGGGDRQALVDRARARSRRPARGGRRERRVPAADHAGLRGEQEQRRTAAAPSSRSRLPPLNTARSARRPGSFTTSGTFRRPARCGRARVQRRDVRAVVGDPRRRGGAERQAPGVDEVGIGQLRRARVSATRLRWWKPASPWCVCWRWAAAGRASAPAARRAARPRSRRPPPRSIRGKRMRGGMLARSLLVTDGCRRFQAEIRSGRARVQPL